MVHLNKILGEMHSRFVDRGATTDDYKKKRKDIKWASSFSYHFRLDWYSFIIDAHAWYDYGHFPGTLKT